MGEPSAGLNMRAQRPVVSHVAACRGEPAKKPQRRQDWALVIAKQNKQVLMVEHRPTSIARRDSAARGR